MLHVMFNTSIAARVLILEVKQKKKNTNNYVAHKILKGQFIKRICCLFKSLMNGL
jgi:hypothetical protein